VRRAGELASPERQRRPAIPVSPPADYAIFREVSVLFASEDNPQTVFRQVAERAREIVGGDLSSLCLIGTNSPVIQAEFSASRDADRQFPCRLTPVRVRTGELAPSARWCPILSAQHAGRHISIPLRLGSTSVGALCISLRTLPAVTDQQRSVLQQLADAAAAAAINAVRGHEDRQRAVLEERQRLSRELHDSMAQVLAYLRVRAAAVRGTVARGDGATAIAELDEMAQVALDAYHDVREAILGLRETVSSGDGLAAALRMYGEKFSRQSGIAVGVELEGREPPPLASDVEVQLVRVVQEALTNVRKHASATRITIRVLHADGATVIEVEDDGRGFDREAAGGSEHHFGLRTMQERLEQVGGLLEISSTPGCGTTVRITIGVPNGQTIGANRFLAERPRTAARAS